MHKIRYREVWVRERLRFQFSIGDAVRAVTNPIGDYKLLVSILYWRCPAAISAISAIIICPMRFQFSIGDAHVSGAVSGTTPALRFNSLLEMPVGGATACLYTSDWRFNSLLEMPYVLPAYPP